MSAARETAGHGGPPLVEPDRASPAVTFGAHMFVWSDRLDDVRLGRALETVAGLGLGFLEIPIGDDVRFDARAVRRRGDELGVSRVLSPGADWPMECDISLDDPAARQRALAWHARAIELCAECGAVAYTGAIYGHPGRVGPGPPRRAELVRVADGLRQLAERAEGCGVKLAIEPMSHFRTHVVNTPRQVVDLIRLVGHDNLFCLFDTYHACTEITSYSEALSLLLPRLWGIHACESNRGIPGTGFLPWHEMVGVLTRHGWGGFIGFESYNSACRGGDFARSRGMFHDVCPDGDEFVRRGKAFLAGLFSTAAAAGRSGRTQTGEGEGVGCRGRQVSPALTPAPRTCPSLRAGASRGRARAREGTDTS